MNAEDRYDSLIQYYWDVNAALYGFADDHSVDWRLLKCQVRQESGFNPLAVSAVGARGLLQVMEGTWGGLDFDHAFNPETNLNRGSAYLGQQWKEFAAEEGLERWRFALAAYNAGLGNILKAQALAQKAKRDTSIWGLVVPYLPQVTGPDNAAQTLDYCRRIVSDFLASRVA